MLCQVHPRLRNRIEATDVADWLVRMKVPFRHAHEISGSLVRFCEENGLELDELTDEQYLSVSLLLTGELRAVLTAEASVASRDSLGGTAPQRVAEQLDQLSARLRDPTARSTQ